MHDPYNLLRVGDVIRYSAFTPSEAAARDSVKAELEAANAARLAASKTRLMGRRRPHDGKPSKRVRVRFVVRQVVSPFGEGLQERAAKMRADPEGTGVRKGKGSSIIADLQVREGILEGVPHGGGVKKQEAGKVAA